MVLSILSLLLLLSSLLVSLSVVQFLVRSHIRVLLSCMDDHLGGPHTTNIVKLHIPYHQGNVALGQYRSHPGLEGAIMLSSLV